MCGSSGAAGAQQPLDYGSIYACRRYHVQPELLDESLSGLSKPEGLLGQDGLFRQLKKALRSGL